LKPGEAIIAIENVRHREMDKYSDTEVTSCSMSSSAALRRRLSVLELVSGVHDLILGITLQFLQPIPNLLFLNISLQFL
jgi:hypothetical protein